MTTTHPKVTELHDLALQYDEAAARAHSVEAAVDRRQGAVLLRFVAAKCHPTEPTPTDLDALRLWSTAGRNMLGVYDTVDMDQINADRAARRNLK